MRKRPLYGSQTSSLPDHEELQVALSKSRESDEIVVNQFTESSAQDFRDKVQEESAKDPSKPIIIYIDSYGGEVDALAKMIETLDETPNTIVTVALGKAMSCGAILLSHGDIRLMGKHTRVMVHEVSGAAGGDVHDVNADAQEIKRLNRHFMNLLANNCRIKGGYDSLRKMIKDKDGRDLYMDASTALKFGIVDAIGKPKINKISIYQVEIVGTSIKKRNSKNKPVKGGKK